MFVAIVLEEMKCSTDAGSGVKTSSLSLKVCKGKENISIILDY